MSHYQFSFEKLDVWQEVRRLVKEVYILTRSFPADEKYSLVQQIRRAISSVSANIAEGTTRISAKEQSHFTTISFSSLMEVLNYLIISTDLGYMNEEQLNSFRLRIQPLSVRLSNLKRSQLARIKKV